MTNQLEERFMMTQLWSFGEQVFFPPHPCFKCFKHNYFAGLHKDCEAELTNHERYIIFRRHLKIRFKGK